MVGWLGGWEVVRLRDWEIGGLRSGYQRTNEWASVLGIVTGLRIINSHELMCTAATAATTRCLPSQGSGDADYRLQSVPVSQSSFYKLKLKLLCLSSQDEINICCCSSFASFLASLYLPPLATNYTQLEKLPSPRHPSRKREKITSLPNPDAHPLPPLFAQCI